jgi:hypothetical protein
LQRQHQQQPCACTTPTTKQSTTTSDEMMLTIVTTSQVGSHKFVEAIDFNQEINRSILIAKYLTTTKQFWIFTK